MRSERAVSARAGGFPPRPHHIRSGTSSGASGYAGSTSGYDGSTSSADGTGSSAAGSSSDGAAAAAVGGRGQWPGSACNSAAASASASPQEMQQTQGQGHTRDAVSYRQRDHDSHSEEMGNGQWARPHKGRWGLRRREVSLTKSLWLLEFEYLCRYFSCN